MAGNYMWKGDGQRACTISIARIPMINVNSCIIEPARAAVLETYYREITSDIQNSATGRS